MKTSLYQQYEAQRSWRSFDRVFRRLGAIEGKRILDLGAGSGFVARSLSQQGAEVTAVDGDADLVQEARLDPGGVNWMCANFGDLDLSSGRQIDGIWSSFAIAYVEDPVAWLTRVRQSLSPGGWIAVVEMADLLNHEPLGISDREAIAGFVDDARLSGRYWFDAAHRLDDWIVGSGLSITWSADLDDLELCFDGPASDQVLNAWRRRLSRMPRLQSMTSRGFTERFLHCLADSSHRSHTRVRAVVARRPQLDDE
ncbi:MAG: class I SAM-dependent methyltransferase [Pseudomonadota bacterium]